MVESHLSFVKTRVFTAVIILVQVIGYFNITSFSMSWGLLALLGTIIGTVSLWFTDPIKLKAAMLSMGFIWLIYQTAVGAYGQLPGEFVFIAGIITSLILLTKAKRNGTPLNEVEELPTIVRKHLAQKNARKTVFSPSPLENTPLSEVI